jgi:hypothetical protein
MGHHLAVVLWRLEQNSNRIFAHATPVSELHAAVPSSQPEVRRPVVNRRSSLVPLQIPRDADGCCWISTVPSLLCLSAVHKYSFHSLCIGGFTMF